MYSGYFEKSLPLFSHQDLCSIAGTVGIQEAEIIKILSSDQFKSEVRADRELASALGVTGVPYFLVDMKYAISGAQPVETFIETVERAWRERA